VRRQNSNDTHGNPLRDKHYPHGVIEELMMGAYSASRVSTADPSAEDQVPTPTREPVIPVSAPAEPPAPGKIAAVVKWPAWVFFAGGLIGAVLGIASLHVEIAVVGLILACTGGLVLLKLRADSAPAEEIA